MGRPFLVPKDYSSIPLDSELIMCPPTDVVAERAQTGPADRHSPETVVEEPSDGQSEEMAGVAVVLSDASNRLHNLSSDLRSPSHILEQSDRVLQHLNDAAQAIDSATARLEHLRLRLLSSSATFRDRSLVVPSRHWSSQHLRQHPYAPRHSAIVLTEGSDLLSLPPSSPSALEQVVTPSSNLSRRRSAEVRLHTEHVLHALRTRPSYVRLAAENTRRAADANQFTTVHTARSSAVPDEDHAPATFEGASEPSGSLSAGPSHRDSTSLPNEDDPPSRSYRVRRRLTPDGDEEVSHIDLGDLLDPVAFDVEGHTDGSMSASPTERARARYLASSNPFTQSQRNPFGDAVSGQRLSNDAVPTESVLRMPKATSVGDTSAQRHFPRLVQGSRAEGSPRTTIPHLPHRLAR